MLSFRGAKRRGNPFSLKQQCFLHGVKETRIATASLRTGLAMTEVFYTLPFLLPIGTLCPLATPQSLARQSPVRTLGKGVSRVESRADGKRKSRPKQPLSFRGAKRRGNPFSLKQQCFLHGVKETRIATASLRTGLAMTEVFYTLPFLLPIGTLCPLATPQSLARQLP